MLKLDGSCWLYFGAVTIFLLKSVAGQAQTIGRPCTESTECNDGAYCASNKRCACLTSFVDISGYCWRKINPGEAGCTHNRQCEAVWPSAYCSSGTCKCGNNQDPLPTLDGYICVNYGECPIGEHFSKLHQNGQVLACEFGIFYSPVANAFGRSQTAQHTRPYDCPETYDCICDNAQCTGTKFCCPSRNYACTLNYDSGAFPNNGGGTLNRWYHDPITNECKQFLYRGLKGNANNFQSKEHCESYCLQTCDMGRPEYASNLDGNQISGSTGIGVPQAVTCDTGNSNTKCRNQFTCTSLGTRNLCCPSVDSICSRTGGISYSIDFLADYAEPTASNPYDSGVIRAAGADTFSRWYYDRSQARCRPFTWNGQAGNFNRFLTQSHCEQFCSKTVCTAGIPLKDTTGITNYRCSGSDTNCPTTHECKSNLCCPRPQFVCKLNMAQGNCANYVTRWWFNAATGNCEEFIYSGCQGNANNFENYNDCQSFCKDAKVEPMCIQGRALKDSNQNYLVCGGTTGSITTCSANYYCYFDGNTYGCCPSQAYTCSLSFDEGRECGPSVTRWYYDSTSRKCQTFSYKGCDGNSNNFATQQDCSEYCRTDNCPDGGQPYTELNGQPRTCTTDVDCPNTHRCSMVSMYENMGLTTRPMCCPSKTYICSLSADTGTRCSTTTIPRYFFNSITRTCEPFTYNGCAGNRNNFPSMTQCANYCLSSACQSGSVVSLDRITGVVTACSVVGGVGTQSNGCPSGYTCKNSQLLGQNVCCGPATGTEGLCPTGSAPFINALTLQAQQCTPNVAGSCPGGYFCWYSTNNGNSNAYFCCQEATKTETGLCPPQLKPIAGQFGSPYKLCSPSINNLQGIEALGQQGSCGNNEYCQYAETIRQYICCGSTEDTKPNVCPPEPFGLTPYYMGRDYRNCNPLALPNTPAACPKDAACLWINNDIQYICCRQVDKQAQAKSRQELRYRQISESHQQQERMSKQDVETAASHCAGQRGFRPVEVANEPVPCSPYAGSNSCSQHRGIGAVVTCMHSRLLHKFVCCYSLWRLADDHSFGQLMNEEANEAELFVEET